MRISATAAMAIALVALVAAPADAAPEKKVPYYASISAGRARMRTGPSRTYPASWLYQRADLPVKVVAVIKEWRKVQDPDGTEGWMQDKLISSHRTAIVHGAQPIEMRERPGGGGRLLWRAAPGVIGRIGECGNGWCRLDVKGQAGYVQIGGLWGVDEDETLP